MRHGKQTKRLEIEADDSLLTIAEVAEYLRANPATIYRLVARGVLPGRKVRGAFRFKLTDIDRWRFAQEKQRR